MPNLHRDIPRTNWRKPYFRPLHTAASKDSVSACENFIELLFRNVLRRCWTHRDTFHCIESKASKLVPQMAPCVQVPVLPIVHEPLRGDFTLSSVVLHPVP